MPGQNSLNRAPDRGWSRFELRSLQCRRSSARALPSRRRGCPEIDLPMMWVRWVSVVARRSHQRDSMLMSRPSHRLASGLSWATVWLRASRIEVGQRLQQVAAGPARWSEDAPAAAGHPLAGREKFAGPALASSRRLMWKFADDKGNPTPSGKILVSSTNCCTGSRSLSQKPESAAVLRVDHRLGRPGGELLISRTPVERPAAGGRRHCATAAGLSSRSTVQ